MNKYIMTRILIQPDHSIFLYSEREAAVMSHLSVGVLRHLRVMGLVIGEVIDGRRRYREDDILQLRRIRRLHEDLGVNLAGVAVIIRLLAQLDEAHHELEQARQQQMSMS